MNSKYIYSAHVLTQSGLRGWRRGFVDFITNGICLPGSSPTEMLGLIGHDRDWKNRATSLTVSERRTLTIFGLGLAGLGAITQCPYLKGMTPSGALRGLMIARGEGEFFDRAPCEFSFGDRLQLQLRRVHPRDS